MLILFSSPSLLLASPPSSSSSFSFPPLSPGEGRGERHPPPGGPTAPPFWVGKLAAHTGFLKGGERRRREKRWVCDVSIPLIKNI